MGWMRPIATALVIGSSMLPASGTPANKAGLEKHYAQFLPERLNQCSLCHLPSNARHPETLDEIPHNYFGTRLRLLGEELRGAGETSDIATRLKLIAKEDSDHDGVSNELELLLGFFPGDASDTPSSNALANVASVESAFTNFLASFRWRPFEPVQRPAVPQVDGDWVRNPIDSFIAAGHASKNLKARPEAPRPVLLRRVYLDLIGLAPTPEEISAFEHDFSPDAYDKVVDRLLNDPRHGERWARHWMDIWRYSDWAGWSGGNQIRDSQPHIWRWRDWIIESLNEDKGYDRMVAEMLAADELAPEDPETIRATGFLVRNYKMLSREQWLEDTINHTSRAFLGVTMHCAKCHDHRSDPISQMEYFQMRAIFEPHKVRIDHVPGETDTKKAGLARAYDAEIDVPTWFFVRGDERQPLTNKIITAAVPHVLGGALSIEPVSLPLFAHSPEKRPFVIDDQITNSAKLVAQMQAEAEKANTSADAPSRKKLETASALSLAEAKHEALLAVIHAERLEDNKEAEEWKTAAKQALSAQRNAAVRETAHNLLLARHAKAILDEKAAADDLDSAAREKIGKEIKEAAKKLGEAEAAFAKAEEETKSELTTAYKPRPIQTYPASSTGRRLAFAHWLTSTNNPLTARVAVNHIWLRHIGQALVPTVDDFGAGGRDPAHPELVDWLAAELMAGGWKMRAVHRLIVTSAAYQMASTPDQDNLRIDPDNVHVWRMPSRRMEAEIIRDNILFASGQLDPAMGGPEIDHTHGLTSKRRSIYLRIAAEKEVEFLNIFDGPSVTECYERKPSVMPHQALALTNSELTRTQAKHLAGTLSASDPQAFISQAFTRILARAPTPEEERLCLEYLARRSGDAGATAGAKENLILVLFNHHDFVTIR
jgi:hypothetical protein